MNAEEYRKMMYEKAQPVLEEHKSRWEMLRDKSNAEAPKAKQHHEHHEESMQLEIISAMQRIFPNYADYLVHNCNEFRGSVKEGAKRKRMGVRKGFPDLSFFYPTHIYHGLHIELKFGKNKQSKEQKEYQELLTKVGYEYVVCRSVEEFVKGMNAYINFGSWKEI